MADHDCLTPIGRANHSINFQDAPETHPRKSRPSATAGGVEPFDQKATPHTNWAIVLGPAITIRELLVRVLLIVKLEMGVRKHLGKSRKKIVIKL
jgi:hypothetical protein